MLLTSGSLAERIWSRSLFSGRTVMESENESRPLLRTVTRRTKRSICKRIPYEVAITGVIIGCFLTVVTVLLLLENLKSTENSKESLTIDRNLLGFPLNYNGKASFKSKQNRDPGESITVDDNTLNAGSKWMDEWREAYNVENFGDSLTKRVEDEREFTAYFMSSKDVPKNKLLLRNELETLKNKDQKMNKNKWEGLRNKGNKTNEQSVEVDNRNNEKVSIKSVKNFEEYLMKRLDEDENILDSWKKLQYSSKNPVTEKEFVENFLDSPTSIGGTDINLVGSPFKYNKKALDVSWQNKKEFTDYIKEFNSKWKDWTKTSDADIFAPFLKSLEQKSDPEKNLLGSRFEYNKKALDIPWQDKIYLNRDFNKYKWDNVDKGWKKYFPLGSTFKTENIGNSLQMSERLLDSEKGITKSNVVNGVWNKVSQKDDNTLQEFEKFNECWKAAENQLKSDKIKEKHVGINFKKDVSGSVAAPKGCPFSSLGNNLFQSPAATEAQVNCALLSEQVRRELGKCIDLSFLPKECKPVWKNKCFTSYKYRMIDGSCNNQIHPTWGKSGTPFMRMITPVYGDGVSSIRTSKKGEPLPNARFLSQKLYSKKLKPDIEESLLFMYFGLFVDHDMLETGISSGNLPCCDEKFLKFPESRSKECLEIAVSPDDPFYGPRNVRCLGVVRSMPVNGECVGRREQLNAATSYLDGSAIYGSTMEKMKSLRSFSKGQLRSQDINKTPFMASSDNTGYTCGTPSEPHKCFDAGDSRVNMLVELTAMHTLWYREHNKLAEELQRINPKWTDETLFQEARRILIAELQYITFKEFLPLLLGDEAMDYFKLNIDNGKYYNGYDDTIDPSVYNVFGAAAFRFGHSLAQDVVHLVGPDNSTVESIPLRETYFNPELLYHKGLDYLLRGAVSQQLRAVDSYISKEIREHLFQAAGKDFGHDLAAVGIQRGRDHGIPGYTKWRLACGLSEIKTWEDLKSVMDEERVKTLKEVYQFVEDIDLIPGGLAEEQVEGSLLGPTYLCLIGRQFKKTRQGDRLWFELQDKLGSFTADQLKEIYKSCMARIVCDNSDDMKKIQKLPFKVPSPENLLLDCETIPKVNLSQWKSIN